MLVKCWWNWTQQPFESVLAPLDKESLHLEYVLQTIWLNSSNLIYKFLITNYKFILLRYLIPNVFTSLLSFQPQQLFDFGFWTLFIQIMQNCIFGRPNQLRKSWVIFYEICNLLNLDTFLYNLLNCFVSLQFLH